ncbi:hypothetical protein ACLB2K_059826 [Fragaria x ananassa]
MRYGIDPDYDIWCAHGEEAGPSVQVLVGESSDHIDVDYELPEVHQMYKDAHFPFFDGAGSSRTVSTEEDYKKKVEEAEVPLYPGCKKKHTKLSATLIFYKFKADNGLADSSFDELLEVIKDMLPEVNTFPESLHTIKKFLKGFDLGYEKIDACINDCCLFRGEKKKNMQNCPECNASRWKVNPRTNEINAGVPAKVLRYFPIIPRIKRMFLSASNSELLTWHSTHHSQDDMMRHPVDSIQWRTVDQKWPSFASEPRNLRFGLATDGFNPYKNLSSTHSIWPVILVIYNLPPNVCMSSENLMLSLLIPGPKQPGNDIDVYLEPLIDDLKELWTNGVEMYDAYKRATFYLKAILLWTVNDFPAYGNLAGLTTKGEFACPVCGPDTCSKWLALANKTVYLGYRKFLAQNHPFRSKHKWFDGTKERRRRPKIFTGLAVVHALRGFKNNFGKKKKNAKKKYKKGDRSKLLKKKSIFFDLPYWEVLPLRHNLDVMHIEKNVCESVLTTILDVNGKSKIENESRRDLELLELMEDIEADFSLNYYGIIREILVLDYYTFRLAIFRCDWANIVSGVKKEDGFTLVNLHDGLDKKDPFILASHAKQVFYSRESESSSWYVVLKAPPRGFHDLELFDESVFMSYILQDVSALDIDNLDSDES